MLGGLHPWRRATAVGMLATGILLPAHPSPAFGEDARVVAIRVRDSAGALVPIAKGIVRKKDRAENSPDDLDTPWGRSFAIVFGKASISLPRLPVLVTVYGGFDLQANPLPLAPRINVAVGAEDKEIDILLDPGVGIEGKTLDANKAPMSGVVVSAFGPADYADSGGTEIGGTAFATATSGADGTFRLTGLGQTTY